MNPPPSLPAHVVGMMRRYERKLHEICMRGRRFGPHYINGRRFRPNKFSANLREWNRWAAKHNRLRIGIYRVTGYWWGWGSLLLSFHFDLLPASALRPFDVIARPPEFAGHFTIALNVMPLVGPRQEAPKLLWYLALRFAPESTGHD